MGTGRSAPGAASRVGAVAALAALVALGCLSVDLSGGLVDPRSLRDPFGGGRTGGGFATVYSVDHVVLALTLLVAGVGLARARTRTAEVVLAALAGLCAAQLAGLGVVAFRRWPAVTGALVGGMPGWTRVKVLALVLAAACAVAAVTCLVVVVRRRRTDVGALAVSVPLGLVVVAVLPLVVPDSAPDLPDRVAVGLQYGVPLGVALALTGLLETLPAAVVTLAVGVSGCLMPLSWAFVDRASLAVVVVVGCALVVGASRVAQDWQTGHQNSRRAATRASRTGVPQTRQGRSARP